MPLSPEQSAQIIKLGTVTTDYVKQISDAVNAAFHADKDDVALQLLIQLQRAIDLKTEAANLATIAEAGELKPKVENFQATVKKLNDQKVEIDKLVNAVGTIATVLSTINQIASAAASLAAML